MIVLYQPTRTPCQPSGRFRGGLSTVGTTSSARASLDERARSRRQGRRPREAGRSAATRLDAGEHTCTLLVGRCRRRPQYFAVGTSPEFGGCSRSPTGDRAVAKAAAEGHARLRRNGRTDSGGNAGAAGTGTRRCGRQGGAWRATGGGSCACRAASITFDRARRTVARARGLPRGVHGHGRRKCAGTLADDHVVRPMAQRVPHQVADRHAAPGEPTRVEAQAVRPPQPQLQRVLDRDDAPLRR